MKMKTKITAALVALACAAAIGAAVPAEAATLGYATLAGKLELAKIGAPAAADSERFQVWNVRGGRHGRRHGRWNGRGHGRWNGRGHGRRHGGWGGFGFAPLLGLGLALSQRHSAPPPAPAPAWQFDGYRYVCNYVDSAGRPLCR